MEDNVSVLRTVAILVLSSCLAGSAVTQVITNEDVIELTAAEVEAKTILLALKSADETQFDTSTSALVALKRAGVSDDVLHTMVLMNSGEAQHQAKKDSEPVDVSNLGGMGGGGFFESPVTGVSRRSAGVVIPGASVGVPGLNVGIAKTQVTTRTAQVPPETKNCEISPEKILVLRPVQAVCVDKEGTPHPAARPSSESRVDANFNGEIYRCMSGTAMQVTVGEILNGSANFDTAKGYSCKFGDALVHMAGGELKCAVQIPQRNCNERSLLRRNGTTGFKLIQTKSSNSSCAPVVREGEPQRPAPIVFDAGVGQGVY